MTAGEIIFGVFLFGLAAWLAMPGKPTKSEPPEPKPQPRNSTGWIVFWVIVFWPIAVVMIIDNARAEKNERSRS